MLLCISQSLIPILCAVEHDMICTLAFPMPDGQCLLPMYFLQRNFLLSSRHSFIFVDLTDSSCKSLSLFTYPPLPYSCCSSSFCSWPCVESSPRGRTASRLYPS